MYKIRQKKKTLIRKECIAPPNTLIPYFLTFHIDILNAELGRLCPFSAQRGTHFQLVSLGSPPRVFHGQIFIPDKHKVKSFCPHGPNALSKSDPHYSPLKKLKRLEKNLLSTLVIFIYHNC